MKKFLTIATAAAIVIGTAAVSVPASAQQLIYVDPMNGPICSGPLGPGRCADIQAWFARQGGFQPGPFGPAPMPQPIFQPQPQFQPQFRPAPAPAPAPASNGGGGGGLQLPTLDQDLQILTVGCALFC